MLRNFRIWLANLIWFDPSRQVRIDYNHLITQARNCAEEYARLSMFLSNQSEGTYEAYAMDNAHHWVILFSKDNPGRASFVEMADEMAKLDHSLDEIMNWLVQVRPILKELNLDIPPEPKIDWLPF